MKKTKMQKLMRSTNLILQGRRILALLLVAVMVFSVFGIAGLGGGTEEVAAQVDQSTSKAKRVVLDTFDEMRSYKTDLSADRGTKNNPYLILEIAPNEGICELGYSIGGCEPIDMTDQVVLKSFYGNTMGFGSLVGGWSSKFFPDEPEYDEIVDAQTRDSGFSYNLMAVSATLNGYYEKVEDGHGKFKIDSGAMVADAAGDYIWHTVNENEKTVVSYNSVELAFSDPIADVANVGDRIFTTRTESNYIEGNYYYFKNYERFLKDGIGLTDEQAAETSVIIKTITTAELNANPDWVVYADLIYIYNSTHNGTLVEKWCENPKVISSFSGLSASDVLANKNTYKSQAGYSAASDITAEVAYKILLKSNLDELFAGVILDDQVYNTTTNYTKHNVRSKVFDKKLQDTGLTYDSQGIKENMYKLMVMLQGMDPAVMDTVYCAGSTLDMTLNADGSPTSNFGHLTVGASSHVKMSSDRKNLTYDLQPDTSENPAASYWSWFTFRFVPSANYIKMFYSNQPYQYWMSDAAWAQYRVTGEITQETYKYITDGHVFTYKSDNSLTFNFATSHGNTSVSINDDFTEWLDENELSGTNGDAIGYILGVKNKKPHPDIVIKDMTIRILDIEPSVKTTASSSKFDNNEEWEFTEAVAKEILQVKDDENVTFEITHMTTAALNSNILDLNSNYDMIYIGLDCGGYTRKSNGFPKWNDSNMGNMIITHSGDLIQTHGNDGKTSKFVGGFFTWNDDFTSMTYTDVPAAARNEYTRFGGNDITYIKYNALYNFAKAGLPIVVDYVLYNCDGSTGTIENKTYIDFNSYLYKLMVQIKADKAAGKSYRLYKEGDADRIRAAINSASMKAVKIEPQFNTYVGSCTDSGGSVTFTAESRNSYLPITSDGRSYATFKITAPAGYQYDLYVDIDQDSKFTLSGENSEWTTGGNIPGSGTKTFAKYFSDQNLGIQHWMIRVYDPAHPEKYASREGYCAVKKLATTDKKEIRVLQVKPEATTTGLNLEYNTNYSRYFAALQDYDVEVVSCSLAQYEQVFKDLYNKTGTKFTFDQSQPVVVSGDTTNPVNFNGLKQQEVEENDVTLTAINGRKYHMTYFNMLIFGFGDMYGSKNFDNSYGAVDYIKYWIAAGKGILFCHDLTCFRNLNTTTYGYTANYYLRDDMGMNSNGVVSSELKNTSIYSTNMANPSGKYDQTRYRLQQFVENNNIHYTRIYDYNSDGTQTLSRYVQGYAAGNLRRMMTGSTNNQMPYEIMPGVDGNNLTTTCVQETNVGQVTQYPYLVDTNYDGFIEVETTHAQYYTVNVEDEYTTVWYSFAAGKNNNQSKMYSANPKDGANNYYIYSRKNVFYSGVGHTDAGTKLDEVKLFINTMIAAYRAGAEAPVVYLTGDDTAYVSSKYYRMDIAQLYDLNSTGGVETSTLESGAYKTVEFTPVEFSAGHTDLTVSIWYVDENGNKCPVRSVYTETGVEIKADNYSDPDATEGLYAGGDPYGRLRDTVDYHFYFKNKWADGGWPIDSTPLSISDGGHTYNVYDTEIGSLSQGKAIKYAHWRINNNKLPDTSETILKISVEPLFVLD